MKKTLIGPLAVALVMALLGAMFIYFYVSINRMEKTLTETQAIIADNSTKIQAVVNFFNTSQNANGQTN